MFKRTLMTLLLIATSAVFFQKTAAAQPVTHSTWWEVQSVDTVKYSRDLAREKLNDKSFDAIINQQVKAIAQTGATHIALGTPYDEEFLPYLRRWVSAAHANNLNVWFRGNFSGWEGWFKYKSISREEHLAKTRDFILNNKDLFSDGDIFTPCPECENGSAGDPRQNGDVVGFQNFLSDEYKVTQAAFKQISRKVKSNFASMNGDVAILIMDKNTTKALDGIVTIDHYVSSPQKLASDIVNMSLRSGGKIVLGEFGAPIPDIHGNLNEVQQAAWISQAFAKLADMPELYGLNYWTNTGSSTQLWDGDGRPRLAVSEIMKVFIPNGVTGKISDELGNPVAYAKIYLGDKVFIADDKGNFRAEFLETDPLLTVKAEGYVDQVFKSSRAAEVVLPLIHEGFWFKLQKMLRDFIARITSFYAS